MENCILFGASPDHTVPADFSADGCLVVCADGGYDIAKALGVTPHVVIGDFDSTAAQSESPFAVVVLPREKDDTDLLAAVKLALDRGCRRFRIFGALGGRLDHSYGNLSVLQYLADHGASGTLENGSTTVYLRRENDPPLILTDRVGQTVSVFPFGAPRCTVTYRGLQYPLEHGELSIGVPLGVSNVVVQAEASVAVEVGTAVILVVSLEKE